MGPGGGSLSPATEKQKDMELLMVNLRAKKFPTVVLNCSHVFSIFNSGFFFLTFSSQNCSVHGEGTQLLGLPLPRSP